MTACPGEKTSSRTPIRDRETGKNRQLWKFSRKISYCQKAGLKGFSRQYLRSNGAREDAPRPTDRSTKKGAQRFLSIVSFFLFVFFVPPLLGRYFSFDTPRLRSGHRTSTGSVYHFGFAQCDATLDGHRLAGKTFCDLCDIFKRLSRSINKKSKNVIKFPNKNSHLKQ